MTTHPPLPSHPMIAQKLRTRARTLTAMLILFIALYLLNVVTAIVSPTFDPDPFVSVLCMYCMMFLSVLADDAWHKYKKQETLIQDLQIGKTDF